MKYRKGLDIVTLIILCSLLLNFSKGGEYIFDDYKAEKLVEYSIDTQDEDTMYKKYIQTLLNEKLYSNRDAYDACHYLMVPMYYAFQSRNVEYINMFRENMEEFSGMAESDRKKFRELSDIDKYQYMYWVSEYMYLCTEYDYSVSEDLFRFMYEEMSAWTESYTGNWESTAGYGNMWELFEGLLSGEGYANGKSYEHVIVVNDLKVLAIICDLKYVYDENELQNIYDTQIFDNAVKYINQIMDSQITWYDDGTWQFQVGAWGDYPDYEFAGIEDKEKIEEELYLNGEYKVKDAVWDSNHFMQMPLYLRSYERVQKSEKKKADYVKLLRGLSKTFVKKVLVAPNERYNYYRLTNYMDGRNGLYRYGYHEDGIGYGPYQQSSEFLLGWWAFCDNDSIFEAYDFTSKQFPLNQDGKEIYKDPVTVRKQNPIFLMENYEQFLCFLAAKLKF